MILYKSNYFRVVINMSQVPIKLSPLPTRECGRRDEGGAITQLIPNFASSALLSK